MPDFVCEDYRFDPASGVLRLHYAFEGGPRYEEQIVLPAATRALTQAENGALDRVFRLLLLACGVSYYKTRAPDRIRCSAFALDPATAALFRDFYVKGLGEFAWRNGIELASRLEIVVDTPEAPAAIALQLPRLTCVPVGGGKDSIVTIESLRDAGEPLLLFALGRPAPIEQTIAVSGLPAIHAARRLDPGLLAENARGALNGHVPITGILSMITVACGILHGFDVIAMSNERSANAPNVGDVNHQFSKSFDFEQAFARFLTRHVLTGMQYFSFLRPLSEAAIARRFSRQERYLPVFLSCNSAFRQREDRRGQSWCCDCPKCRFVFLALAPFMDRQRLIDTFGANLLDDPSQLDGFAELCGVEGIKPFECVGEVEESAALMAHLATLPAWRDDRIVRSLGARLPPGDLAALLAPAGPHRVPQRYLAMLDAAA